MKDWTVKIIGKPVYRISISYIPLNDTILFKGQLKISENYWDNFVEISLSSDIDLTKVKETLFDIYTKLDERSNKYIDLNKSFGMIKEIEISSTEI